MKARLEYRVISSDDGHGNPCAGNWSPIEWPFDHQRAAEKSAGRQPTGLGAIHVEQALRVEFRQVPWTDSAEELAGAIEKPLRPLLAGVSHLLLALARMPARVPDPVMAAADEIRRAVAALGGQDIGPPPS